MISGEFSLIKALSKNLPKRGDGFVMGVGDDSAVILGSRRRDLIVSIDTMVQDVHFRWRWTSPFDLGWKLFEINASDMAAMGGRPRFFFVSLALPKNFSSARVLSIYRGIRSAARKYRAKILGGDTNATKGKLTVTGTVLGDVKKSSSVYRGGAKVGDDIYVTGRLGEAAFGFYLLEKRKRGGERFKRRFLRPVARVDWARRLTGSGRVHSMIDISDGLLSDLRHIINSSGVGAEIWASKVPGLAKFALTGGEDYELLFTAGLRVRDVIQKIAKTGRIPVTRVGVITGEKRLKVLDRQGKNIPVGKLGYEHF